jgi:aminopeptidase 2
VVIDRIWPEYLREINFVGDVLHKALELDAKFSSHPIEVEIPDEGKITQVPVITSHLI